MHASAFTNNKLFQKQKCITLGDKRFNKHSHLLFLPLTMHLLKLLVFKNRFI